MFAGLAAFFGLHRHRGGIIRHPLPPEDDEIHVQLTLNCFTCQETFVPARGFMHVAPDPTIDPVPVCAKCKDYLVEYQEAFDCHFHPADSGENACP